MSPDSSAVNNFWSSLCITWSHSWLLLLALTLWGRKEIPIWDFLFNSWNARQPFSGMVPLVFTIWYWHFTSLVFTLKRDMNVTYTCPAMVDITEQDTEIKKQKVPKGGGWPRLESTFAVHHLSLPNKMMRSHETYRDFHFPQKKIKCRMYWIWQSHAFIHRKNIWKKDELLNLTYHTPACPDFYLIHTDFLQHNASHVLCFHSS